MASGCGSIGDIRFSSAHGRNIQLLNDGTTASWKLCRHNGYCFTTRPLKSHEKVTLQAHGSGHVLFGLVYTKPDLDLISNKDASSVLPSAHWEHFRLLKKGITIVIYRDKSEVTMRQGTKTIVIHDNANLFILLELKFGNLDVEIESDSSDNTIVFDKTCGPNVELLSQNRRVCLKQVNPHAICGVNRNIYPGETIHCSVSPNEDASWTRVEFFLSNCSPEYLQLQGTDHNLTWNKDTKFKLVPLGVVLEDGGTVQLCFTEDGEILSNHNMKIQKENFQELDVSRPIFLYIDLFRMQTTIWTTSSNSTKISYVKAHRITPIKGLCDSNRQTDEASFPWSDTDEDNYVPMYSFPRDSCQATSVSPHCQDTTDLKQLQESATEKKEVVTQVHRDESATCGRLCDSNRQTDEASFPWSDTDEDFEDIYLPIYSFARDSYQATSVSPHCQDTTDLKQLHESATEKKEIVTQVDRDESATCDDQTMRKGLHDVFRNVGSPTQNHSADDLQPVETRLCSVNTYSSTVQNISSPSDCPPIPPRRGQKPKIIPSDEKEANTCEPSPGPHLATESHAVLQMRKPVVQLPRKNHKSSSPSTGQDDSSLTDSEEEYITPLHKPCGKYSPTCAKPNVTQANHNQPDVANVEPDHSFTRPNAIKSDSPLTHTQRVPPVPKPRLSSLQYVKNKDQIKNRRDVTSKPISPGSDFFPLSTLDRTKVLGDLQPTEQAPAVPPGRARENSPPLPSTIDEEGASGNIPRLSYDDYLTPTEISSSNNGIPSKLEDVTNILTGQTFSDEEMSNKVKGSEHNNAEASGTDVHPPPLPPRRFPRRLFTVEVLEQTIDDNLDCSFEVQGNPDSSFVEKIQRNREELVSKLDPDIVADYLYQERIMSESKHSAFLHMTRKNKNRIVLDILQTRPCPKEILITALKSSSQEDILKLLHL